MVVRRCCTSRKTNNPVYGENYVKKRKFSTKGGNVTSELLLYLTKIKFSNCLRNCISFKNFKNWPVNLSIYLPSYLLVLYFLWSLLVSNSLSSTVRGLKGSRKVPTRFDVSKDPKNLPSSKWGPFLFYLPPYSKSVFHLKSYYLYLHLHIVVDARS